MKVYYLSPSLTRRFLTASEVPCGSSTALVVEASARVDFFFLWVLLDLVELLAGPSVDDALSTWRQLYGALETPTKRSAGPSFGEFRF